MIRFVDVEASSLKQGGFPVEVAWVDQDGQGETYLIRPAPDWLSPHGGVPEWSPASERLHGISLTMLMDKGTPHKWVAARVAAALMPKHVLAASDAPGHDGQWLGMLLSAAGIAPSTILHDVQTLYGWACRPLLDLLPPGDGPAREAAEERVRETAMVVVARAEEVEALRPRVQHRALPDAESLWRTWRTVRDEVARRVKDGGLT
jgi:hypothetical protein